MTRSRTWSSSTCPAIALGLGVERQPRAHHALSMLEVLRQDYVRTARAKGLSERVVVIAPRAEERDDPGDHAVRASSSAVLLGGTVVLESIFSAARPRHAHAQRP